MPSVQEKEMWLSSTTKTILTNFYKYPIENKAFLLNWFYFKISLFRFNVKCKYCTEVKINNLQNKLKSKCPNVRVNIKNSYFTMGSLFFLTFKFLA